METIQSFETLFQRIRRNIMGHYDSCYEADAERKISKNRKNAIKAMADLDPIVDDLNAALRKNFFNDDARWLKRAWDNFQKEYIAWQYNEGLIIKDPKIIIDILKDK